MSIYIAFLASLLGLWASWKIYSSKQQKKKLVCPLKASCDMVVHSHYATTLGLPNEIIGIGYFSLVALLLAFVHVEFWTAGIIAILFLLVTVSVLFSLYLIFVQAFTLKAWCSWCTLIALCNVVLWLLLHRFLYVSVLDLFVQTKLIWLLLHNMGFILGVGGATITDVFFFRFLKDFKITALEKSTMDHLSQIIWIGLIILVMSGYFLYLPQSEKLLGASKFLLKLVVVAVIIINGIFLNLKVAPELASLSFEGNTLATHRRRLAFALGAISLVSWYSAFILGSLRSIPITLVQGISVYGGLLVVAIIGSQVFERRMVASAQAK